MGTIRSDGRWTVTVAVIPAEVSAVKLVNDVVSELYMEKRCQELWPGASFSELTRAAGATVQGSSACISQSSVCVVMSVCLCVGA